MKKLFVSLLTVLSISALSSCNPSNLKRIGVLQFVTVGDLDDAYNGFVEGLKEEGFENNKNIKIELLNPQTDASTMQTQAAKLVRESDLLLGIATPAAVALKNEINEKGKSTPLLFTAVTDPVNALLVEDWEHPGREVTGTSDLSPIRQQVELVKKLKPSATKLGILYTSSETNSQVQAEEVKAEALAQGLEVVTRTIATITDLPQVFGSLINTDNVNAIYIPTDNLIASNMGSIAELVDTHKAKKVPIIGSTVNQVRDGASITLGFSYFNLGKQTGKMAADILNGKKASEIAVETIQDLQIALNKTQLEDVLGLSIPTDLLENAEFIY